MRGGIAPLEVLLVLPVLILLWLVIFQIGFCYIRQAEVTVTARSSAWRQRAKEKGEPFTFENQGSQGRIEKTSTGSVKISGISAAFPDARSRHTVMAGTWSHPDIDLNEQPNFQLAFKLARLGPKREIIDRLDAIEKLVKSMTKLKDAFSNLGSPSKLGANLQSLGNDVDYKSLIGDAVQSYVAQEVPAIAEIESMLVGINNTKGQIETAKANASKKNAEQIDAGVKSIDPLAKNFNAQVQQKGAALQMKLDTSSKSEPDLKKDMVKQDLQQELSDVKKFANDLFSNSAQLKQVASGLFRANGKESANAAAATIRDHFVAGLPKLGPLQQQVSKQIADAEGFLNDKKPKELQEELKKLTTTMMQLDEKIRETDQMLTEFRRALEKSKD